MTSIKLLSGKTIEVETSKGYVEVFGTEATLKIEKRQYTLMVRGNREMTSFFGVNIDSKLVFLAISSASFQMIEREVAAAKRLLPKEKEAMSRYEIKNLMSGSGKMDFEN